MQLVQLWLCCISDSDEIFPIFFYLNNYNRTFYFKKMSVTRERRLPTSQDQRIGIDSSFTTFSTLQLHQVIFIIIAEIIWPREKLLFYDFLDPPYSFSFYSQYHSITDLASE